MTLGIGVSEARQARGLQVGELGLRDKCQRFVGRNKTVSHGDCVKSSTRTLYPTIKETHDPPNTGAYRRMGQNYSTGSTSGSAAVAEPPTQTGLVRLQKPRQQSVDQAQDGSWVVLSSDGLWQMYDDKALALRFKLADPDCLIGQFNEIAYAQT